MINLTFRNINRLFVISLKNDVIDPTRNSFVNYYIHLKSFKDFNVLIDKNSF